jgi:hypothetical protein
VASDAPTIAAARTRGCLAMKKICASVLSANGIVRLNTREREIDVVPSSGPMVSAASSSSPNPVVVANSRVRIDAITARGRWA